MDVELERFREEWRQEVKATTKVPVPDYTPRPSTSKQTHRGPLREHLNQCESSQQDLSASSNPVEIYAQAVQAESEGKLNDAVLGYRKAFKLDPNVDKAYHRTSVARSRIKEEVADPLAFNFSRTLQLGPDYNSIDIQSTSDEDHPSSTSKYLKSLLRSFQAHPFESDNPVQMQVLEASASKHPFIPENVNKAVLLARLPDEVLSVILTQLMLPSRVGAFPKLGLVEAFAISSRKARLLTLADAGLYKRACRLVYQPPYQIPPPDSEEERNEGECDRLCEQFHGNDWRRFWLEQPRIRTDGCFISVVSYLRRGETENAWVSPSHLVTYYRFLRFLPDGTVISLVTTVSPSEIARSIDMNLRMKGLSVGRWKLREDTISCWNLTDPLVDQPKYTIEQNYRLKSTSRGKMNKLVLNFLKTANHRTNEVCEVSLQGNKSFFFSPVRSYEGF